MITKNRFIKYLIYALGEIILIIIGILIALSLNQKSNEQEKKQAFANALSQVYTNLHKERGWYEFLIAGYQRSTELAQLELQGELNLTDEDIPKYIYYFNSIDIADFDLGNDPLLNTLQENITSNQQRNLVNKISGHYALWDSWNDVITKSRISFLDELVSKHNLPFTERYTLLTITNIHGTEKRFSKDEINKAKDIRSDSAYPIAIKSSINRNLDLIGRFKIKLRTIKSLISIIQASYPQVSLSFDNIIISGSAVEVTGNEELMLQPVNNRKTEWRGTFELGEGVFTITDMGYRLPSWGKSLTDKGRLLFNGFSIPAEKGTYEISVDFSDMKYSLNKIQ
ncbi:MAG: hypothetical protein R3213_11325 [Flavobacteriaceae bacterium]|nr:hypothetical protein [Flavobacteriaceae bacterium]